MYTLDLCLAFVKIYLLNFFWAICCKSDWLYLFCVTLLTLTETVIYAFIIDISCSENKDDNAMIDAFTITVLFYFKCSHVCNRWEKAEAHFWQRNGLLWSLYRHNFVFTTIENICFDRNIIYLFFCTIYMVSFIQNLLWFFITIFIIRFDCNKYNLSWSRFYFMLSRFSWFLLIIIYVTFLSQ